MDYSKSLDDLINAALDEDLKDVGDITSESIFTNENHLFRLISKDDGVLCGIDIFETVILKVDPGVIINRFFCDGNVVSKGDLIAEVSGNVVSVLKAERTAINFLSILSGVATKTARFVEKTKGRAVVLCTRKTIPGFRQLQKYAVSCGGGSNHRMGLFDMVMIKDNHIDAAGGIRAAVKKVRDKWGSKYKIEVETRNIPEVQEALSCKVDVIMLDNMSENEMIEAVKIIDGKCKTEASGNITLERVITVARTGVDFISSGELTNSVKAFDFSLKE